MTQTLLPGILLGEKMKPDIWANDAFDALLAENFIGDPRIHEQDYRFHGPLKRLDHRLQRLGRTTHRGIGTDIENRNHLSIKNDRQHGPEASRPDDRSTAKKDGKDCR